MTFITNNLFLTIICCLNEPGEHCTTLYIPNHPLVIEIVGISRENTCINPSMGHGNNMGRHHKISA